METSWSSTAFIPPMAAPTPSMTCDERWQNVMFSSRYLLHSRYPALLIRPPSSHVNSMLSMTSPSFLVCDDHTHPDLLSPPSNIAVSIQHLFIFARPFQTTNTSNTHALFIMRNPRCRNIPLSWSVGSCLITIHNALEFLGISNPDLPILNFSQCCISFSDSFP